MNVAAEARAAALSFEAKKDGLTQLQDGSWVLKLKVHPNDIPPALLTAPMGTRFMSALVEVGDDETPVPEKEQAERTKPAKNRKRWNELPPAQQAAMRCVEPGFRRFLEARYQMPVGNDEDAAALIRTWCGVKSRSQIGEVGDSSALWKEIDADYQFWLRHPEAA